MKICRTNKKTLSHEKNNGLFICTINKSLLYLQCVNDTEMFDKVEGLNDREEMLDHLRFLIRYEEEILEDGILYSESEFYDELYSTITMIAESFNEE